MSSFKRCSNLGNQKKFVAGLIGDSLALSSLLDLIRGVLPSLGLFYCLLILADKHERFILAKGREKGTHTATTVPFQCLLNVNLLHLQSSGLVVDNSLS
jgi:hypothetical protein